MTTELSKMTQEAFAAMAVSGDLQKMVQTQVTACVKRAIEECTGYGSAFMKGLNAYVAESLPMDFRSMNLAEYNGELMKVIQAKLDGNLQVWIDKTMSKQLGELLEAPPAEIMVSELVATCRKEMSEDEERDFSLEIKVDESSSTAGYWSLQIGKRGDGYRLAVTPKGEIYSVSVPYHGDVTKRLFACRGYGLDRVLWRLYACKTRLVRDGEWE